MENLVTSKEVSEKLKKLGVKQESAFYYAHEGKIRSDLSLYESYLSDMNEQDAEKMTYPKWLKEVNGGNIYSAYLISELKEPLKPYMNDIVFSPRDDIFNPDFWGNLLVYCLRK